MKYMLLIYQNSDTRRLVSSPEGAALMGEVDTIMKELAESGELVTGAGLAEPPNTKTVRVRNGVPAVTDGPFAEAKEHFGGFLIVDCDTIDRATEIAARWPNARFFAMEVRPLMDTGSEPAEVTR